MGFSQKAGMPASTQAKIRGACAGVDAAMTTASGPESRISWIPPASPPTSPATFSARWESSSPTRISSTRGSPAGTPAWRAPIRPAPSRPTFTRSPQRRAYESLTAGFPDRLLDVSGSPSHPSIDPPVTMLPERPFRVNGPLAGYAVAEIRGCVLVEEQGGAPVALQHRGRYGLRNVALERRRDGAGFVRARSQEQDLPGFGDGCHADRDGPLRRAVRLEVAGVDEAGALGERHDPGARIESRPRLV